MDEERAVHPENWYAVTIDEGIDEHFLDFNRFLRLAQEPQVIRQSLVGETLCRRAHNSSQLSFLLLETHPDTLCELLKDLLDSSGAFPELVVPGTTFAKQSSSAKRSFENQAARAANK